MKQFKVAPRGPRATPPLVRGSGPEPCTVAVRSVVTGRELSRGVWASSLLFARRGAPPLCGMEVVIHRAEEVELRDNG